MVVKKVTVYSCSGCSNVAQLANSVAVKLDRKGIAKMSCVAGIGGNVDSLLNVARKSEKILVLDGCPLECAAKCLKRHNIDIDSHLILTKLGLKKVQEEDVSPETVQDFLTMATAVVEDLSKEVS